MGSQTQRFCLRWNNHQSNLLSVFDQLLHEEAFVDVTLAVEGKYLRAHKMVLSACSPYFQTLFVGHPDKHPIVILKDVPYSDMRSLLDFMYRGEVSVDEARLTAFLKVAESLKIKGLTEVNEESCDLPSIANSLHGAVVSPPQQVVPQQAVSPQVPQQATSVAQQPQVAQPSPIPAQGGLPPPAVLPSPNTSTPVPLSHPPPPPNLHRLPMPRRVSPPSFSPLIPRRKRGRPRKLDCSGPTPLPLPPSTQPHDIPHNADIKYNNVEHNHIHEMSNGTYPVMKKENAADDDGSQHGALKKEENKMDEDDKSHPETKDSSTQQDSTLSDNKINCVDGVKPEPTPSTSSQDGVQEFQNSTTDGECFLSSSLVSVCQVSICEDVSLTPTTPGQSVEADIPMLDDDDDDDDDADITPINGDSSDVSLSPVVYSSGIHFLSDESLTAEIKEETLLLHQEDVDSDDDLAGRRDLLEYFMNRDGSVVCKWCGELLPSRTHWYRHKYKFHMSTPPGTTPLFKCYKCNVFFKSRKGYLGHVSSRHATSNCEKRTIIENSQPEMIEDKPLKRRRSSEEIVSHDDYKDRREKEEKLVAEIIDRVKRECEAQGSTVTRKGYSRRSTVMNS